ncbi:MAG: LPXTG cell wall anchor domain-containing protein, partial [Ruminococcus bromii]|nr:LPXTG cell wall anchor domain-containing protein [Ruminococcus bromii]
YFSSTADTEPALPESLPSDAVDLSNEAKTVYVENIKNTTEITVEKKWKDANNNDVTATKGSTISFDLYQIASTTPPGGGGSGEGETGTTTGVSYVAKCNTSIITGTFSDVAVGDTVKVSVNYTWQASSYRVAPSEWSGVSDGTGEYANNGYTYEYTCKIMSSPISFKTGDREESIQSIHCTLVEAGTSSDPDSSGSGDGEETTDPTPAEPTGTYIDTYTISNTDGWTWSKDDLPLTGTDKDNNTIYYTYYVVEHSGTNYSTSYENNGGISSGTITIKNTESDTPVYELPETGGPGTTLYSAGGLLLMAAAGRLLLHKRKKRRKEDSASS